MYVTSGFMERLAELHKYKASDLGLEKLTAFMKPGIDRYKGPEIVPKLLDCMAARGLMLHPAELIEVRVEDKGGCGSLALPEAGWRTSGISWAGLERRSNNIMIIFA